MEPIHYFIIYCVGFVLSLVTIKYFNTTDREISGWSGPNMRSTSFGAALGVSLLWPLMVSVIGGFHLFEWFWPTKLINRFTNWFEGK